MDPKKRTLPTATAGAKPRNELMKQFWPKENSKGQEKSVDVAGLPTRLPEIVKRGQAYDRKLMKKNMNKSATSRNENKTVIWSWTWTHRVAGLNRSTLQRAFRLSFGPVRLEAS
jgi:hypothetical protein